MTSHWQRWVVHESIQETVESPPPYCTLRICYPFHFPHSSFSNLLIFCAPHFLHFANSTLSTPRISPNPLLATIFLILVFVPLSNRPHKTTKSFLQDLLEVFLEFTPNRPNSKVKCVHCRWPGRNDKLCTRLFSLATNTSVLIACISYNNLWYTLDKSAVKIGRRVLFPSAHVFQIAISSASLKIFFLKEGDIGLCGFAVLDNFSWGMLVVLISKYDIISVLFYLNLTYRVVVTV